jgi:hypothetical protein
MPGAKEDLELELLSFRKSRDLIAGVNVLPGPGCAVAEAQKTVVYDLDKPPVLPFDDCDRSPCCACCFVPVLKEEGNKLGGRVQKILMRAVSVLFAICALAFLSMSIHADVGFAVLAPAAFVGFMAFWFWDFSTKELGTKSKIFVAVIGAMFAIAAMNSISGKKPAAQQAEKPPLTKEEKAKSDRKTAQMQMAALGLMDLQRMSKDPKAFAVKSVVLKDSGVACYTFSGINGFGVTLTSNAVMAKNGKLYLKDRGDSKFYSTWNAECSKPGGEEVGWFIKRVLD